MIQMAAVVVKIGKVGKHPKADHLEITQVLGRCTIFPEGEYKQDELAVYIEPGTVVPCDRPEFEWLSNKPRTKVRKAYLRGIPSYGFLIPYTSHDGPEGTDVSEDLGIESKKSPPKSAFQRFVAWLSL